MTKAGYIMEVNEISKRVIGIPYTQLISQAMAPAIDRDMAALTMAHADDISPENFVADLVMVNQFRDLRNSYAIERNAGISHNFCRAALVEFADGDELSWTMASDGSVYGNIDGDTFKISLNQNQFVLSQHKMGDYFNVLAAKRNDLGQIMPPQGGVFQVVARTFDIGDAVAAAEMTADQARPMRHSSRGHSMENFYTPEA